MGTIWIIHVDAVFFDKHDVVLIKVWFEMSILYIDKLTRWSNFLVDWLSYMSLGCGSYMGLGCGSYTWTRQSHMLVLLCSTKI